MAESAKTVPLHKCVLLRWVHWRAVFILEVEDDFSLGYALLGSREVAVRVRLGRRVEGLLNWIFHMVFRLSLRELHWVNHCFEWLGEGDTGALEH